MVRFLIGRTIVCMHDTTTNISVLSLVVSERGSAKRCRLL